MTMTTQEIEHVATLARLELTPEEKSRYATELSIVLDYVGQLNDVPTDGVLETCQVTGLTDVMRDDIVKDSSSAHVAALIGQFPVTKRKLLKVPGVFE